MTLKSILVHCADERRLDRVLHPALALARIHGAHLSGISILPAAIVQPAPVPGGVVTIIDGHRKAYDVARQRMRTAFEEGARLAGVQPEWIAADAGPGEAWQKLSEYGRLADLVIVSQADNGWGLSHLLEAPAETVMHSGRPVLIVPNEGSNEVAGRRVLVAWNGRREAARAVFDGLPILKDAPLVSVVSFDDGSGDAAGELPGAELCTALARHGVNCEAATASKPSRSVGEAIFERARQTNAGLVVMGCYGHSRLREFILGGVTRYTLKHLSVPVLMSH